MERVFESKIVLRVEKLKIDAMLPSLVHGFNYPSIRFFQITGIFVKKNVLLVLKKNDFVVFSGG